MEKLQATIDHQGRKKRWLAGLLGLTRAEFWQKETGYRGSAFSPAERKKIAQLLGVSEPDLFPEAEHEPAA
jgi:transcriptional regulator with XRE-family HTH domain